MVSSRGILRWRQRWNFHSTSRPGQVQFDINFCSKFAPDTTSYAKFLFFLQVFFSFISKLGETSFFCLLLAFSVSFWRAKNSLNCCCSFCWSHCRSCWHTNNAGSRVIKSSGPFLSGKEKTWQKLEQKCSFINFRSILHVNIEQCV